MGLTERLSTAWNALTGVSQRSEATITFNDYLQLMSFNSNAYLVGAVNQTLRGNSEDIDGRYAGLVQQAYKDNGVVFACMLARQQLFSEARFQFQRLRGGRPTDYFGTADLDILEHPWPNGVTGDLLARAIQDADLGGNFFCVRRRGALRRLRPDWVTIVLGSEEDPDVEAGDADAEVLGYIYHPGGKNSGRDPVAFLREEVAHFAPIPDPLASFRGMSWLTPIIREIQADISMTRYKNLFFENGAAPSVVVSLDPAITGQAFKDWVTLLKDKEPRGWDRYKTMFLGAGAKVEVIGSTMEQINFKTVQGAGETRIAAAAGVPPVIVGLSEGLQAATYSNYSQARRRFADNTMRPLWRNMAGSLETVCPPPSGSRLWYDDRDIQALADDKKDLAEIAARETAMLRTLTDGGFQPDTAIAAVTNGYDWSRLVHTGLTSVQLLPPMPDGPPQAPKQLQSGRSEEPLLLEAGGLVRCTACAKLLAEHATPPYRITCPRCGIINEIDYLALPA